jgi:hypothetical protein
MSEDGDYVLVEGEEVPLKSLKGGAETERRRKLIGKIADDYLDPEKPIDVEDLSEKYDIPVNSIYYYFKKEGISRKDVEKVSQSVQKEVRKKAQEVLSGEAEKIATIAFGLGSAIAKQYLPLIDYMMRSKTLEMIAEEIMQWYETKHSTNAHIDELETQIEKLNTELSAAYAMNLPNFRYWLRTRILERYANQVIQARLMGVKLPVKSVMKAMQTDLLVLESDIKGMFEGESIIGTEP